MICAVVEVLLVCFLSFFTVAASRVTRQNVGMRPFDPNGSNDSSAVVTHTLMMLPGLPLQHWPCFYKQNIFHSNWSISKPSRHRRSLASSTTKTEAFAFLFCDFVNFKGNVIVACGEDQFSCSLFLWPVVVTWRSVELWADAWQIAPLWHLPHRCSVCRLVWMRLPSSSNFFCRAGVHLVWSLQVH